ncbi:hypothetical protein IIA16_00295 [bacterium]|nr:hypothetical protein [bacterium]
MDAHRPKGPYSDRHDHDQEQLRRIRESVRPAAAPPQILLGPTPAQKVAWLIPIVLLTGWAAKSVAGLWGMTVPGAWLVMVGSLLVLAATIWKTSIIWSEVSDWGFEDILMAWMIPFRYLHAFFLLTDWERMKGSFYLGLQGWAMIILGFIANAIFRAPST